MKKIFNWYKGLYTKHKILTVIGTLIALVLVLGVAGSDTSQQPAEQAENTQTATEAPAEAEQAEKPQEQQPAESLAARSEKALKTELQVTNFSEILSDPNRTGSPLGYIASFEDVNSSTVRVVLQTDLDRDEANNAGRIIFGLFGLQVEEVDTLVVRDSSGVDKANVYRRNVPVLNVNN